MRKPEIMNKNKHRDLRDEELRGVEKLDKGGTSFTPEADQKRLKSELEIAAKNRFPVWLGAELGWATVKTEADGKGFRLTPTG